MEYASGGELFEYIVSHSRIKEQEACLLFQQILAGVEYISKLSIVHRDLKPENLLLDHKKQIKIVDFGLSNTFKPGQFLKTACGSPCYAAPEMIAGKRYHGTQVDIWSCGVILFALICGYLPFEDSNTSMLYKKIISGEYKCPKFLSEDSKDLVSKILNTNPEERYKIEQIKTHKWYRTVTQELHSGIFIGEDVIHIENKVLGQLEQYGVASEIARKYIEGNKHNHITTTYYLLLKKYKHQPVKEAMDAPRPLNKNMVPKLPIEALKKLEHGKPEVKTAQTQKYPSTSRSPMRNNFDSSPKPPVCEKSSRKSISPTRKAEENIKVYSGPYNIDCISGKSPAEISKDLILAFEQSRTVWRQTLYTFACHRGTLRFTTEIVKLEGNTGVHLLKFSETSPNTKEYLKFTEQIINTLSL